LVRDAELIKLITMLTTNDVARVYETILSIPGMNETVKIDLKISRKNVLLLSRIIERGLTVKDANGKTAGFIDVASKETLDELSALSEDCLRKAGLTELNEKLSTLNTK
jgi:hypothetical protein